MLCGAHIHSVDPKLRCCYCCTYFLAHAAAICLLHFSISLYFPTSVKSKLAKLKGSLRVQPSGRRKDEPQRSFISVRYYEVWTVLVSLYFGFQTCVRQESSVIRHLLFHQRLPTPPHPLLTHYEIRCIYNQEYFLEKNPWIVRDGPRCSDCAPDKIFQGIFLTPPAPKFLGKISS